MVKVVKAKEKLPLVQKVEENWKDRQFCYLAIEKNPEDFQKCEYQDEKFVKRAVYLSLDNVQFVQDKFLTHTYVLQLVKKNPEVVEFLPTRLHTRAIAYEALKQDPSLIFFLNGNETYQLKAVGIDGLALEYCQNPSKKVIKAALKNNGEAIEFVKKDSPEYYNYCVLAVKSKGSALRFIDKNVINKELCLIAINQNQMSLKYVPDEIKPEVEERAQTLNAEASIYARNPIYEAAKYACLIERSNILYFKKPIIDKILQEVNYKTEGWILKIKIFLRRLGFTVKR